MHVLAWVFGGDEAINAVQVEVTPERAREYLEVMERVGELKGEHPRTLSLSLRMDDPYPKWLSTVYQQGHGIEEVEEHLITDDYVLLDAPPEVQGLACTSGDHVVVYPGTISFATYHTYDGTHYISYEVPKEVLEQIAEGALLSKTLQK